MKFYYRSIEWGGEPGKNCYNETTPIEDPNYWGSDCDKRIMQVIGEVFGNSKFPITFLNITQLSSYRKDAHTSIYKKQWNPLSPEQVANPVSYADCTHWCLPGLQDTWNELLFTKLFYPWNPNGWWGIRAGLLTLLKSGPIIAPIPGGNRGEMLDIWHALWFIYICSFQSFYIEKFYCKKHKIFLCISVGSGRILRWKLATLLDKHKRFWDLFAILN